MDPAPAGVAQAREQFLSMVGAIRPELHRYCARLTGSVIEGEDIVQTRWPARTSPARPRTPV